MTDENMKIYPDAVKAIKSAILKSRYLAARLANAEQLKLYYSVGGYVSANTRHGKWGTGAIAAISRSLQAELPGLRGFSPSSMKYMRQFFEEWNFLFALSVSADSVMTSAENRQLVIGDLEISKFQSNRQSPIGDLDEENIKAFLSIGFAHHIQIFSKCKSQEERFYYIRQCAANFWTVSVLKRHLAAGDFNHVGTLPNNFALTMPDARQVSRAVLAFKDEYLLNFAISKRISDIGGVNER